MSCLRTAASLMLWPPKMNGIKAQGTVGVLAVFILPAMVLILVAFAGMAEEPTPVPAPPQKTEPIPVLSVAITNDTLTLSWPKSATNWMLSTQAVNDRRWNFAMATLYKTNETEIYLATALPVKTTFYRLIKTPPGFRNRVGKPPQPPPLPPLPAAGAHTRPTNAPPHP
jgi:hypothetical protein